MLKNSELKIIFSQSDRGEAFGEGRSRMAHPHLSGQRIFPVGGREYQEYSVIFAQ